MTWGHEAEVFLYFFVILLVANLLAMLSFVVVAKLPEGKLKQAIRVVILELDTFADCMENNEKREIAIRHINEILGWRQIFVPGVLIGWVIDAEVAAIRAMEESGNKLYLRRRAIVRKTTLAEIGELALQSKNNLWSAAESMGRDVKLYLHWSAGHYGQFFEEYHINIDQDGSIYVSTDDFSQLKSHTYKRNTGSIGIALACCYNATTTDLGPEPPTTEQIETLSQVVAILCKALDLTVDIYHVMTHAEAANNLDELYPGYEDNGYPDGKYGPGYSWERWDLWVLTTNDVPGRGGNTLRGKAIWYQQQESL